MYQRILVPYDGSATSVQGLDEAIRLARLTGGSLRLVHLVEALYFASGFETAAVRAGEVVPLMRRAGTRILQAGQARVEQAGVSVDTWLVEHIAIRLADEVGEQVRHWGADLIVIGTHGRRGVGRLLLGSDAEQILTAAQETHAGGIVDGGLGLVEGLEGILLILAALGAVGLEEAGVAEADVVVAGVVGVGKVLVLAAGKDVDPADAKEDADADEADSDGVVADDGLEVQHGRSDEREQDSSGGRRSVFEDARERLWKHTGRGKEEKKGLIERQGEFNRTVCS